MMWHQRAILGTGIFILKNDKLLKNLRYIIFFTEQLWFPEKYSSIFVFATIFYWSCLPAMVLALELWLLICFGSLPRAFFLALLVLPHFHTSSSHIKLVSKVCSHLMATSSDVRTSLFYTLTWLWLASVQMNLHSMKLWYWFTRTCLLRYKTIAEKLTVPWTNFATSSSPKLLLLNSSLRRTILRERKEPKN